MDRPRQYLGYWARHADIGLLLADGGRLISIETATSTRYSYSAISPSWYFDYFVTNGWTDCKVYVAALDGWPHVTKGAWPVIGFNPTAHERPNAFSPSIGDKLGVCTFVAEKGLRSTTDKTPTQSYYRGEEDTGFIHDAGRTVPSLDATAVCRHWRGRSHCRS